jgi:hypothetical protein
VVKTIPTVWQEAFWLMVLQQEQQQEVREMEDAWLLTWATHLNSAISAFRVS